MCWWDALVKTMFLLLLERPFLQNENLISLHQADEVSDTSPQTTDEGFRTKLSSIQMLNKCKQFAKSVRSDILIQLQPGLFILYFIREIPFHHKTLSLITNRALGNRT